MTFTHGEGVYLFDETGKKHLDFTSGIGVMNLGYSFEAGKAAVKTQVDALAHLSLTSTTILCRKKLRIY